MVVDLPAAACSPPMLPMLTYWNSMLITPPPSWWPSPGLDTWFMVWVAISWLCMYTSWTRAGSV